MGIVLSRHRHRQERELLHDKINQLSLTLQALQKEMDAVKSKADNTARHLSTSEKDILRENLTSNQKLNDITERFTRLANKLESDSQDLKVTINETRMSHGHDVKNILQMVEEQDTRKKELLKTAESWKESFVSLKDFSAMKAAFNELKQTMETEKEDFIPTVRRLIKDKSTQMEQELLDMMDRYEKTHSSVIELVALNLAHERDIAGLKYSVNKIEDKVEPKLMEEVLPEPTLPSTDCLRAVHSEASSVLKPIQPVVLDEEDYRLRFSKISCVMKRINEEMNAH